MVSLFLFLIQLENCHEGTLRNFYSTDLAHPLLTLLLLLKKFSLTADITTITLRSNILAHGLDCLTGNDLCSYRCLDGDIELLAWDKFLELFAHLASEIICMVCMDKRRKGIGWIAVQKDIKLHKLRLLESDHMIVKRRIAL